MRRGRLLLSLALVGSLASSACAAVPGGVAATVDGAEITEAFVGNLVAVERDRLTAAGTDATTMAAQLATYQRTTLGQLILGRILEQEADGRSIGLTADEGEELWQTQVLLAGSEEDLRARLDELGLTEDQARRQLIQGELITRLQDDVRGAIVVTDDDLRAVYDSRADQWSTRTASHIAVADAEAAQAVLDRLAGGEAFDALAAELSIDTQSGPLGGGLGPQPRGVYPPEFDDAIWAGGVGEVVGPIETTFGFHVVRIDAIEERTFDDVKGQLDEEVRGQLFEEEFAGLIAAVLAEADVKLDGRYGTWDALSGEVRDVDLLQRPLTSN